MKKPLTGAAEFAACMAEEYNRGGWAVLTDLDDLAAELYNSDLDPPYRKRSRRVARREILERTEGLPYRFDTEDGPLFVLGAAWRHALGEEYNPPTDRLPTWSGKLQAVA